MSDYGMKVSLPGYDVRTATPEQCVMHSGYPSPKVKMDASPSHFGVIDVSFTSNIPAGTYLLYSFAHGYSYRPAAIGVGVYSNLASGAPSSRMEGTLPLPRAGTLFTDILTTDTLVQIKVWQDSDDMWITNGTKLRVSFYVFAEEGAG